MELKLNNLTKRFKDKIAVDNVSMDLNPGVHGLLGANGAGKTTLMRMICSILNPTSGTITFNGKAINNMGEKYQDIIGILPQNFGYYDDFTAYKFLKYIALIKDISTQNFEGKINNLLELVNLTEVKDKKIKTFSGGMKRRLGIAQAIINDPKILVLDEPTVGLDPKERVKFRNIISNMSKDKIIILSTHIVSDVEYISDKIILMKNGKIILNDTSANIIKTIEHKVWVCNVPEKSLLDIETKYNIINVHRISNDEVEIRLVNKTKPQFENVKEVSPSLEDLYLYYFPTDK